MGTTYNVVAVDRTRTLDNADLGHAIEASLQNVNAGMSNWDPRSEISRFNASKSTDPVAVSPELAYVMNAAQDVHEASQGQFDVTVGPLIDLWGFGAGHTGTAVPTEEAIQTALNTSGQAKSLRINNNSLQKTQPDAEIYLSAIGKGFGVDQVASAIEALGLRDYMVEIGGDLYASGLNPDGMPWQIGIEKPDNVRHDLAQVIGVSDMGMASSGDYRNYFEQDGTRYSHVINPATGRPITHTTAATTVLTDNAMLADAWATAMLLLGREHGMEIAESRDLAVLFIERDVDSTEMRFVAKPSSRYAQLQA
ncbi:FAD:protein FMN transferase [Qingshengfaniella alkalisoli]|nr:FAD:protein FMN transferase [Qingshengfaniella alkalisoli]